MLFDVFSLNFAIFLASLHAASRAPCSCYSASSWNRSSNFWALGLRWWGSRGQIIPSDGFWSRMLAWLTTAFVNRTHHIGFRMPELFRRIDEDFCGSKSWNTQPNCRVIFNTATSLLSPFFEDLFPGCSSTWRCGQEHFSQICIHSRTCRTSILEDATFHRMEWGKFLWGNPCKAIKTFYHWDLWFSMHFSHSAA